jgi:hypothetical protein
MSSFVLTASGAVLGAAVAIAIALITKADLQSRATASAAQYQARAAVTSAVLNNLQFSRPVAPSASAPSSETRYLIKRASDNHWYAVRKFTWSPTGIVAVVQGGLTIASDEIEAFMPSTDWS